MRNKETGEQSLVTKPQLFFPGPYEEVEEVRPLIRLLEYETMVIRNPEGRFNFMEGCAINDHHSVASTAIPAAHAGAGAGAGAGVGGGVGKGADSTPPTTIAKGQQRASAATSSSSIVTATSTGAFFLPPYCAIEELQWSTGLRKTGKKVHHKAPASSRFVATHKSLTLTHAVSTHTDRRVCSALTSGPSL